METCGGVHTKENIWEKNLSPNLEDAVLRATNALKQAEDDNDEVNLPRLRRALDKVLQRTRIIRESKVNLDNPKSFFRYANSRLKTVNVGVGPLLSDGSLLANPSDTCGVLSSNFADVYKDAPVPRPSPMWLPEEPPHDFETIDFSPHVVYHAL